MFPEQSIQKTLAELSAEMSQVVKGFTPAIKSNDENYRKDVNDFLLMSKSQREDLIFQANIDFVGVHDLVELGKIAKEKKIPLGAMLMVKSSQDISDKLTRTKTSFWGETGILRPEYRMTVSALDTVAGEAIYDMGWMLAFRTIDARGMLNFDITQFIESMEYYELESDVTEIPLSGIYNGKANLQAPKRYGLGTQVAKWLEGKIVGTSMTEIMVRIRRNATLGKSKAAYRALLKKPTKSAMNFACQGLETARIDNIIANLNFAVNAMLETAAGVENETTVGLDVTATTPILAYYHPSWQPTIDLIERRRVQVSGVLDQLMPNSNIVFVPTRKQSKSGAWTHSGTDKWNFAKEKDAGSISLIGFKLVIPKMENMFIVAQDLFFANELTTTDFTNKIRCEERYLAYMSDLQHAWVVCDGLLAT